MIQLIKYISVILILSIAASLDLNAQNFNRERGLPYIRNYPPEEYLAHENNFDIIQGQDGQMYFANFAGVLQFDGTKWRKISSSSGMRILSVDSDKNGRIYAGGFYDFGYLSADNTGQTNFVSLIPDNLDVSDIGLIFKVICKGDEVLFASEKQIFIYKNGKIEIKKLDDKLLGAFKVNEEIYFFFDTRTANSKMSGLYKYDGNFNKVIISEGLSVMDVHFLIPAINDTDILVGTQNGGLFFSKTILLLNLMHLQMIF